MEISLMLYAVMDGLSSGKKAAISACINIPRKKTLKLTVPAHSPIKRSTLSHILKQANLSVDELMELI